MTTSVQFSDQLPPNGTVWSGPGWSLSLGTETVATAQDVTYRLSLEDLQRLAIRRRLFSWRFQVPGVTEFRMRGVRRSTAEEIRTTLGVAVLREPIAEALRWHEAFQKEVNLALSQRRWFTTERLQHFLAARPSANLMDQVAAVGGENLLSSGEIAALRFATLDHQSLITTTNQKVLETEKQELGKFFASIETRPLTEEQIAAVVCYDNRVQLLAAAGSGKTSVMVARAAYAVKRGFTTPDRVLLLAFNTDAAKELQERVTTRFTAAGISSDGVTASTFHAFGLKTIGEMTGSKPRVPNWVERNNGVDAILDISEKLKSESETYRYNWDLFRTIFAPAPTSLLSAQPDHNGGSSHSSRHETFRGEQVRSHGERTIADFLFLNGIDYEYEKPYSHPTADATHSQYRPDFYYPSIDLWHEHWALDGTGTPPASFKGYAESMAWKRGVHARFGTKLVESTWADIVFGNGLAKLQKDLEKRGLVFDWDPNRTIPSTRSRVPKDADLAGLIATFMAHVKSNSLSKEELQRQLGTAPSSDTHRGYRSHLFLELYWPIHEAWNARLRDEGCVDFNDMLCQAADLLAQPGVRSPYDLILADEFQDASQARARIVQGLVKAPGRHLLAVGDDWQAINRFAGADISVMTDFDKWFGTSQKLALTATFRCPPDVCSVATRFIGENPRQIHKLMKSVTATADSLPLVEQVQILSGKTESLLSSSLTEISSRHRNTTVSVDVLARYNFRLNDARASIGKAPDNVKLNFRTVHKSKGLEADYVIVVGLESGHYGFPSAIQDDPVLALAMPFPETFPHAEERRLFYVAMTRARRKVILLTSATNPSPFISELLKPPEPEPKDAGRSVPTGPKATIRACPKCGIGVLVERDGKYGRFLGCSTYPGCNHTVNIQTPGTRTSTHRTPSQRYRHPPRHRR